jgi:general secretion pathway protein G
MFRKGFTLIELIVVIAIIAILAAIIAPNAFKAVEKAKISGTIEDFRSIKTGAMAYYSDVGTWPTNCTGSTGNNNCAGGTTGANFVSNTVAGITGWDGPYLEKWPATSKWSGNYSFVNNNNGATWNGTNAGERSVNITMVPGGAGSAADKIDRQMDSTNDSLHGEVHYAPGNPTNVLIIVSRDGPID